MNKKRSALVDQYRQMKVEDHPLQTCKVCGVRGSKHSMEPHHPKGRHGENMLNYFWIHSTCHGWIHHNPKEATEMGLLTKGRNT